MKVEEVQIPFTVYDKKGSLVLDLHQEDFKIYEDGVEQEIRYFSPPTNLPLRFGLLLDTSSSTRPRLKFEKEAAMQLGYYVLTKDKDKDHLGFLMQFDRTPEVIQDFTPDAGRPHHGSGRPGSLRRDRPAGRHYRGLREETDDLARPRHSRAASW